ncbi:hypothetical protein FPV67DRAFT_1671686 [Lyophyllum atratum]|nr:hypothetical protein FPV67DRAFT_1671686 [Lyophyllum atratum]
MASNGTLGFVTCPACDARFPDDNAMSDHLATHNDDPIVGFAVLGRLFLLTRDPITRRLPCPITPCDVTHKPADLYEHLRSAHGQGTQDIPTDPSTTLTSLIGQVTTPVMQRAKRKMEWETPANTRSRYTPMTPFSTKAEMPRIPTSARPPPGYRVPSSPIVNNDPWNMDTSASSGPSSVAAHYIHLYKSIFINSKPFFGGDWGAI